MKHREQIKKRCNILWSGEHDSALAIINVAERMRVDPYCMIEIACEVAKFGIKRSRNTNPTVNAALIMACRTRSKNRLDIVYQTLRRVEDRLRHYTTWGCEDTWRSSDFPNIVRERTLWHSGQAVFYLLDALYLWLRAGGKTRGSKRWRSYSLFFDDIYRCVEESLIATIMRKGIIENCDKEDLAVDFLDNSFEPYGESQKILFTKVKRIDRAVVKIIKRRMR